MAGDWIKMRTDLDRDPSVIGIAADTGLAEDHVVGKLWKLWAWANEQTVDGNAPSVTKSWLDRYLGVAGFADSMQRHGWLITSADPNGQGIQIPKFHIHNGKSAKERALTSQRVSQHRAQKCNAPVTEAPLPREEKRREENKNPPKPPKTTSPFEGFDSFWLAYPRKVAKADAQKAWAKLKPDAALQAVILAAIAAHKKTENWRHGKGEFIPHPATWLNSRRWEDDLSPPKFTPSPSLDSSRLAAERAADEERQRNAASLSTLEELHEPRPEPH